MAAGYEEPKNDNKITPYTLLPNDHSDSVITHVVLNGNNYERWAQCFCNALRDRNKLEFLTGDIPKPPETSDDHENWWVINATIVVWIFNTIDEKLRSTISYGDVAKDVWEDIKLRFSVDNGLRIYILKAEIINCKQTTNESIISYFGRLKKLWDDLDEIDVLPSCQCKGCTCNLDKLLAIRREKEMVYEFLMGVDNSRFAYARSHILGMEPLPNLNKVFNILFQVERFQSFTQGKAEPRSELGGGGGSSAGVPSENRVDGNGYRKLKCIACTKEGHTVKKCFRVTVLLLVIHEDVYAMAVVVVVFVLV